MAANKSDSLRGRFSFPLKGYAYVMPTRRGVPLIRLVGKGADKDFVSFSSEFPLFRAFSVIFGARTILELNLVYFSDFPGVFGHEILHFTTLGDENKTKNRAETRPCT